jgi:hypothetical protein
MSTVHRPPDSTEPRRILALLLACLAVSGRAAAENGITFTPSIGGDLLYSDNIQGSGVGAKPDVIVQVSPGLNFVEQSATSDVNLQYSPTFNHFIMGNSSDRVDHSLISTGQFTPFTDFLRVDFNAYATETGGSPNNNTPRNDLLIPGEDRVLLYLGTVVPHFTARFGDIATFDAYYRLKSANTSDQSNNSSGPHPLSGNSLNQDADIVIGSGSAFGRTGVQLNLDHSIGTGSGQNNEMESDADFVGLQYHLDHVFSVNGSIGYQRIHYAASGTTAPFTNEGITWEIGATAAPNVDSLLSLAYGYRQGIYVPTIQIKYALGPLTNVSASYVVTIQNQLQATIDNLQYLAYDSHGSPIDSRTGLPFIATSSIFGTQNVLFRDKPLTLAIAHQFVRSGLTLSATYEKRQSITGLFAEDTAIGGLIEYSREITPALNCIIDVGYTDHRSKGVLPSGNERARLLNFDFSLRYRLSETATIFLREDFLRKLSNIPEFKFRTNQLIIGVNKDL